MNKYSEIFKIYNGPLVSTKVWSEQDRTDTDIFYQHKEKAECALVAMSSWYGGDVFEFGSHDLNTFRNLLTAIHLSGMSKGMDTRFYAFDAFGKFPDMGELNDYFKPYSSQGDQIKKHEAYIAEHGLFIDRVYLIQGLFQDTCTNEFKQKWRQSKHPIIDDSCVARSWHISHDMQYPKERQIGFASLDCNIAQSYKTVFEFIFDMMSSNSYIYMDEGLQNPDVMAQWEEFQINLNYKRKIRTAYIRNAGGFGSLWRLYPISNSHPLEL